MEQHTLFQYNLFATQYEIQHKRIICDIQHKWCQHNNTTLVLNVVALSVAFFYSYTEYAECRYAECRYAEFRYADCHYPECHYAECRYAECRYAEYRYAECSGSHRTVKCMDI
jgi:hypothetical protein